MVLKSREFLLLMLLLVCVFLLNVGCVQTDSRPQDNNSYEEEAVQIKEHEKPEEETNVPVKQSNDKPPKIDLINTKLSIGQDAKQVKDVFGEKYEQVNSPERNIVIWRFDFTNNTEYKFIPSGTTLQKMNVDIVDLEGLKNGMLDGQLFVEFDNTEKVSTFSYYYKGEGNVINVKHVFEDGTIKEETI